MKNVKLEEINRLIRAANNKSHTVTVLFDGETRTYANGEARVFSEKAEPGTYVVRIAGEAGTVNEYVLNIEEPEAAPLPAPAPAYQPPLDLPDDMARQPTVSLLLQMRKMDAESFDKERRFFQEQIESLKREHRADIDRLESLHTAEIDRLKADFAFQKQLIETNHIKLEQDRSGMISLLEKRMRVEARQGKNSQDWALLERLMESPLGMVLAARLANVDIKSLLPVLLAGAGGKGGEGSADLDLSTLIPGMPAGTKLSTIASAIANQTTQGD